MYARLDSEGQLGENLEFQIDVDFLFFNHDVFELLLILPLSVCLSVSHSLSFFSTLSERDMKSLIMFICVLTI